MNNQDQIVASNNSFLNESDSDNNNNSDDNLDELDDDSENLDDLMNDISYEKSPKIRSSFLNINRKRPEPESSKSRSEELNSSNVSHISASNKSLLNNNNIPTLSANQNQNFSPLKKIKLVNNNNNTDNLLRPNSLNPANSNIYSSGSMYSGMFQRTESLEESLSSSINKSEYNTISKSSLTKNITSASSKNNNFDNKLNLSTISETQIIPNSISDNNKNNNKNENIENNYDDDDIDDENIDDIIENNNNNNNINNIINSSISPVPFKSKDTCTTEHQNEIEDDIEDFPSKEPPKKEKSFSDDDVDELELLMDDIDNIY